MCQIAVAAVLLAVPALLCLKAACVIDPDIWWHLRTGEWMVAHHAVPHTDPFGARAGSSWAAYSWLFDLLLLKLFQAFGLPGIAGYTAGMVLAISAAVFRLIRRLQGDFTLVVLLTFAVNASLFRLYTPRPWLFTILFFAVELELLMAARRSGRMRDLVALPVLFALWANVHVQFADGLLVMGLVFVESVLPGSGQRGQTRLRPGVAGGALAACVAATLLNPYGGHIYRVAFDLATQAGVLDRVGELQAIPFRGLPDYALLLLALGAAAALGRARKSDPFEVALLGFAAVVSFRSQREVWVMAVTAAAILAPRISLGTAAAMEAPPASRLGLRRLVGPLSLVAAGLAVAAGFGVLGVNEGSLRTQLRRAMPVAAAEDVLRERLPGPIFNDYNWGGYLMWKLRVPVSMDGRATLQGDERIERSVSTWSGAPGWADDPALVRAYTVIGPRRAALSQLLRTDGRFRLAYEDEVAAVFVRSGRAK